MKKPRKHLLVYADGRVEDAGQELLGIYFVKSETVDGDHWEREFEIHLAHDGRRGGPNQEPNACSMVGIERSFVIKRTLAQIMKDDAERRTQVMRQCLWGIANHPGDK